MGSQQRNLPIWTKGIFAGAAWSLWVILLITIPITSSPLLARLTSEAVVSPLAAVPLLGMVLFWLVPYLIREKDLPRFAWPLLAFVALALLSSLRAQFLEIYSYKGNTVLGREIRAIITLGMGVGFYLIASLFPDTKPKLEKSLRWLYLGAFFLLLWSSVQAIRLPFSNNPPPLELLRIHRYFSFRDLFRNQVTGMAYEPSWFADQLVVLYLPLWLGSVVKDFTIFPFKWKRVTGELFLFLWGAAMLFFTFSRIGMISFFASVGFLILLLADSYIDRMVKRRQVGSARSARRWKAIYMAAVLLIFLLGVISVVFLASQTNERIGDILSINIGSVIESERLPLIYNLANHLEYAERLMYWISAFLVFSRFPFLGVGLGNSGFFFREYVPAFGSYLPEVIKILGPDQVSIANPKSLWLRLLSETGFIGFSLFILFLLLLGLGAMKLWKQKGVFAAIGLAGGLALVAQIFEGFSLDTFALPQLWIMLGLLTALLRMPTRREPERGMGR